MANTIKKITTDGGDKHNLGNIEIAAIKGVEQGSNTLSGTTTQSGPMVYGTETVTATTGSNSLTLNADATFHFVSTATNKDNVVVPDGVIGQIKYVIHKTRGNSTDLVITPTNFAAGTNITSNLGGRSVGLVFDGTNWQVISGEITGTAEMVIA